MAGGFSHDAEGKVLEHVTGGTAYTQPGNYMALFTATATEAEIEAGTMTNEVANANAYARTAITFGAHSGTAPSSVSSNADCTFPAASGGSWGTVTYAALCASNVHGTADPIFVGTLTAAKTVNDGDTFKFNSGAVTFTLD